MLILSNRKNDTVFGKNKDSFGELPHANAEDQDEDSSQADSIVMSKEIYDSIEYMAKEPTIQSLLT